MVRRCCRAKDQSDLNMALFEAEITTNITILEEAAGKTSAPQHYNSGAVSGHVSTQSS